MPLLTTYLFNQPKPYPLPIQSTNSHRATASLPPLSCLPRDPPDPKSPPIGSLRPVPLIFAATGFQQATTFSSSLQRTQPAPPRPTSPADRPQPPRLAARSREELLIQSFPASCVLSSPSTQATGDLRPCRLLLVHRTFLPPSATGDQTRPV